MLILKHIFAAMTDNIRKTRIFLLEQVQDLSIDQVNKIPDAFNNNIVWNLAHLISAHQSLCYLRANVKPAVDEKYITEYKPGTKPEQFIDEKELSIIKILLLSSIDVFESDYQNKIFENYNRWTTRYNVELTNIDDAIRFLAWHEGFHAGYIMALKRLVK